ncbi:hypothetical protein Dsin_013611 [Dipteronia sinensis]|uniref:Phytocyanin domain-containing protein n=1 Tax=Dipteronia sinensis TaxID=43782 RepID=A0AAE0AKA1_9ROSI|nr:hypothetical protein Dsin_013611 [Dipteronia sinensis]
MVNCEKHARSFLRIPRNVFILNFLLVAFHGTYDLVCVLKLFSRETLPNTALEFVAKTSSYLDKVVDLKLEARYFKGLKDVEVGLAKLSRILHLRCFAVTTQAVSMPHIVGGESFGWGVPDNDSFYQEWADSRNFMVGDELVFIYSGIHSVIEVSKEDFEACTTEHAILRKYKGPSTFVGLTSPGNHYYICDFQQGCLKGMKLNITVKNKRYLHESLTDGDAESSPSRWIRILSTVCAGLIIVVTFALVG